MDDDTLLNQIEHLERQAIGYYSSTIAGEQAKAMDYYLSKPFGTEEEGRSAATSSDVWDVVEGLTPLVLKPFVASDDVVRFNALGPDDEEAAQQESDYVNWCITQRNNAFTELVSWVKTGLLQKNGVVKYWWEKSRQSSIERYFGLDDDLFALIQQDEGVEVIEHTVTPQGHDVTLRVTEEVGFAKYKTVAPEEFLIDRSADSPDPQCARFFEHRSRVTVSRLREMGYDVEDDIADEVSEDPQMSSQYLSRRSDEDQITNEEGLDRASREVVLREAYIRVDADGDGMAELRKVCIVGRKILANEETEEIPFCAWTPYPQPHKFYGRCPADETLEIQLIKSTLWRQTLDNIYTINNNRVYANESVTFDDLIDNQIAGVVRIKGQAPVSQSVMSAQITPIGQVVQPMIEYLDSAKENRTGFTRYNQGTDSNSLNKTATGIRIITENANSRVEIIARAFAEQGLVPLMRGIHGLCRRHATKAETIRLRGKWVQVDPRSWKKRIDMSVSVGLGAADQQMRLQGVQMLLNEQKQLMQVGIVQPQNFLASAHKMVEAIGFKNPEQFFAPAQQQGLPPEVQATLQQAAAEIQALRDENQQLKSGVLAKQIEVESRERTTVRQLETQERIAQANNEVKRDVAELGGLVQIIAKKMDIPVEAESELEQEVSEDLKKPDPTEMMAQALQMLSAPKTRRMRITAPSGQVYEGEIAEGQ